jgi:hypothetical protein
MHSCRNAKEELCSRANILSVKTVNRGCIFHRGIFPVCLFLFYNTETLSEQFVGHCNQGRFFSAFPFFSGRFPTDAGDARQMLLLYLFPVTFRPADAFFRPGYGERGWDVWLPVDFSSPPDAWSTARSGAGAGGFPHRPPCSLFTKGK